MFSTMTDRNKFLYLLTNQSVSKIVAQFVVDAFEDIKCNMYILHHITCNWTKIVGGGTLYVLAFHKFLTLRKGLKKKKKKGKVYPPLSLTPPPHCQLCTNYL